MARIPINLPTTHGFVRNAINTMSEETFHIPGSDGSTTELHLEWNYLPPAGTEPNGSSVSPFRTIEELEAVINPDNLYGCTIFLRPGRYGHTAQLALPPNVSWINEGSRGAVVISTSISTANTSTEMRDLELEAGFTTTIGTQQGLTTERVLFGQVDSFSNFNLFGGVTGESVFAFVGCNMGNGVFANTITCAGTLFIFDHCFFESNCTFVIGSATISNRDFHRANFTDCRVESDSFTIIAENTKQTLVQLTDVEFVNPIIFVPGTGTILMEIDLVTYGYLIDAGQDFDIPGVTFRIRGLAEYRFSDTIITGTITDAQLEDVCTLDIPDLQAGQYELTVSFAYTHQDIDDSLLWSFTDSMITLPQFQHQNSAALNHDTIGLVRPVTHPGGAFSTTLQMEVTPGGSDAVIDLVMISMEQKA